ncbi:Uncharacterised protein [Serratia proteamaculans]|nr:Uncharacterised protein [Serratia proteamaculans]CAI2122551.1 Uncharacterised protein [Serratia proteamaculans]CAI2499181.1 Uncharacterised protein [Serratia proteamaculans]
MGQQGLQLVLFQVSHMALFVVLLSKVFVHTLVTVEIITIEMTH